VNRERRRLNDRGRNGTSIVVGLDLVRVSAIVESIAAFGDRFLDRIFTAAELQYCLGDEGSAPMRLAARFAAKEAVLKVLRLNDEAIPWRSIEVTRAIGGACDILLADPARSRASDAGFIGFSLSMTHEADYAGAVVIGERPRSARAQ
jgi:holo-[acyl-carrier protein] synthase